MGTNTASYIQMSDQLGTLEPGKLADLIFLDGNPLGDVRTNQVYYAQLHI